MFETKSDKILAELNFLREQVQSQNDIINKQNEIISNLEKKLDKLDGKFVIFQSEMLVTQRVNKLLSIKVDDNSQYLRQNCLLLDSLETNQRDPEESIKKVKDSFKTELSIEDSVLNDIDRAHRLPLNRNANTQ